MLHPFPNDRVTESSNAGFGAAEINRTHHLAQSGQGQVDQGKRLIGRWNRWANDKYPACSTRTIATIILSGGKLHKEIM